MKKQETEICGRKCLLYTDEHPQVLLIQTLGQQELGSIDQEIELITHQTDKPFVMTAFYINDWEAELTPWRDPAVSKRKAVGVHADETLRYITDVILPYLFNQYGQLPVILGGYSLGGLFSRWAASESDQFVATSCASPSLWIARWQSYSESHPVKAKNVYLSLGDREEFSKNMAIAKVGENVRWEHKHLQNQLGADHTTLEWNPGHHFMDAANRTAKGFAWCISKQL